MNTDKLHATAEAASRVFQPKKEHPSFRMEDNRPGFARQAQLKEAIQRMPDDEDELLQGKFAAQRAEMDEDELLQGKFVAQRAADEEEDLLQGKFIVQRMETDEEDLLQGKFAAQRSADEEEDLLQGKFAVQRAQADSPQVAPELESMVPAFGADMLSNVRLHPDSPTPAEVGALAYTQGNDIHFAPGQFKPDTGAGRQLIGHELAHVAQQAAGRVQPTTEIGGMPVNDDVALENEADRIGAKAAL